MRPTRRAVAFLACFLAVAVLFPGSAGAQEHPKTPVSCTEHIPPGASKPTITEAFPSKGFAGYAWNLELTVTHGKGETVLPEGFRQSGSEAAKALAAAGFAIPDPDGGAGPTITTEQTDSGAVTKLSIPFVALPPVPGRVEMVLPPVPIAVSRASGELVTVCTESHAISIEEPIANLQNPKVMPNADPRPQREEWVLAEQVAIGLLVAAILAAVAAWLIRRWRRIPRAIPVVPPKLPWLAALEELEELKGSTLLAEGRFDEYFDRVSDCVRKYLGARYGFDGLETTSDEMRALLRRVRPPVPEIGGIAAFLGDCDLVKFARMVPTEKECVDALTRGERIVHMTTPKPPPAPTAEAAA